MRLLISNPRRSGRRAFTMVEIALSIAVVAFALVAIMGVLPTGMTVQRDNREDTLIAQEGRFWLEAIKGGARGIEDLPKYVEEIVVTHGGNRLFTFTPATSGKPLHSTEIIALLTTLRAGTNDGTVARIKAITGPAADQGTNGSTFRYQLRAEVTPVRPVPPIVAARDVNADNFNDAMQLSLYDVRLVLRWPVVERGNSWYIGNNRKVFRTSISGGVLRVEGFTNEVKTTMPIEFVRTVVPNEYRYTTNFIPKLVPNG
jgi:type II secretory pathway pseudopilin PulG